MKIRSLRANALSKKRSAVVTMRKKRKRTKMLLKPVIKLKVKKKVKILTTVER